MSDPSKSNRWLTLVAAAVLLLGVAFAFGRAYKNYSTPSPEFNWSERGMSDFHSMFHYSKMFRLGLSPYEMHDREDLIVPRPSAPFSPVIFYLMWPLTYFSLSMADVLACLINLALIGWIAGLVFCYSGKQVSWAWWLAVFGFLVFSRAGHITLYTGYFTAVLVIGTLMAFHHAKERPWLSALGILLASAKPTYIIPLLIILLFRRNYKAAIYGTLLSGFVAFAGLTWMATGSSYQHVIETVLHGQEAFHDDPTEIPINTWTRIDILGMVAKVVDWKPGNGVYLLGMVALLIPCGLVVRRAAKVEHNTSATGISAFIGILALLVTLYHHSYDCLLIAVPCLSLLLFGKQTLPMLSAIQRWTVVGLLIVPSINYCSTMAFRDRMQLDQYSFTWQSITLVNGLCITVAMLILMWAAWKMKPTPDPRANNANSGINVNSAT